MSSLSGAHLCNTALKKCRSDGDAKAIYMEHYRQLVTSVCRRIRYLFEVVALYVTSTPPSISMAQVVILTEADDSWLIKF